ncbi:MAG: sortase [Patescibacteria group bacterium]
MLFAILLLMLASLACTRGDVPVPVAIPTEGGELVEPTAEPTLVPAEPTAAPTPTAVPTLEPNPLPAPVFFLREEVMSGRVALEIPKIGVTSYLRMAEEAMGPNGPYFTKPGEHPLWIPGWGAEIGNVGVALIYGHRQWGPVPKVFTALDRLEIGDTISVIGEEKTLTFTVSESVVVDPENFWATFFRSDDAALQEGRVQIALVTCTPWGTARQRLIVFAELLPKEVSNDLIEIEP